MLLLFIILVSVSSLTKYIFSRILPGKLHVFHVVCRDLGEQLLAVNVGNIPSAQNKFPAKTRRDGHIKIACAHPVGLHLAPVVNHPVLACPQPFTGV